MRTVIILFLLLLASPAFGELTKEDIRTIMKEENNASEKRLKEYIDLKIETVNARIDALDQKIDDVEKNLNDKIDALDPTIDDVEKNLNDKIGALDNSLNDRIDDVRIVMIALITLVAVAIAIPQIIIAFKERGQKEMQTQIDQLRKELEAMQSTPS